MAESWLVALNTVRNCCAHHSRLWNKTLGTKPMIPRDDTAWHEPHEVGNHKMFGTLTHMTQSAVKSHNGPADRLQSVGGACR